MDLEYEKWIRAAFRLIPGIGSGRLQQLITHYGSAQRAWESSTNQYKSKIDIAQIQYDYQAQGISLVIPEESNYPALISLLPDAPPLLYYRGSLTKAPAVAIVGARKATPYGKAASKYLGQELARAGYVVVSGLARGIDTAAHEGALAGNGMTWAFLGCGVDIIYPCENKKLADQIMAKGALISEYPPGTSPLAPHFPARNRLISGASMGVIVAEAALKSGALITVDFALEQGREVFAVPGPIFNEMSKGTNQLLRAGAKLVEGLDDVISELSSFTREHHPLAASPPNLHFSDRIIQRRDEPNLFQQQIPLKSKEQEEITDLLSDLPLHIDDIIKNCTSPPDVIALALLELELEGIIEQLPGQCYVLARHG